MAADKPYTLEQLCADVLAGRSRSYVGDAVILAKMTRMLLHHSREYGVLLDNLTSTQARCTELLEEARVLRAKLAAHAT